MNAQNSTQRGYVGFVADVVLVALLTVVVSGIARAQFSITNATNDTLVQVQATGNVGIGTTNPLTKLHIKGTANDTHLIIDANSTQSNVKPMILLRNSTGTDHLLSIHSDHVTNTFVGVATGRVNAAGSGGTYNTFLGNSAGWSNTTGRWNTGTGGLALASNYSGSGNTANGHQALNSNFLGTNNTADGKDALWSNVNNHQNTGVGYRALYATTASDFNTAIGANAGDSFDNGYNNVFVGANTDVNAAGLFNVIAMGQGTIVTSFSTARFGNSATLSYGGWAAWTNVSDARFKKNVREDVPGLEFIKKLRPITYNFDAAGMEEYLRKNDPVDEEGKGLTGTAKELYEQALREKERIVQTGLVAQEVEAAARELGYDFSGVDAPKNENDYYGLRYAELVVPLVKAVQELHQRNERLAMLTTQLVERNEELTGQLSEVRGLNDLLTSLYEETRQQLGELRAHLNEFRAAVKSPITHENQVAANTPVVELR